MDDVSKIDGAKFITVPGSTRRFCCEALCRELAKASFNTCLAYLLVVRKMERVPLSNSKG